jgi:predicted GIY-YIG superfamily endonuclease
MMLYIIEFSPPLKHAKYYLGYCADDGLARRFEQHLTGNGAAICRAAVMEGIRLRIVATLPGYRDEERRLKRQKNTPRLVRQLRERGLLQ